MIFILRRMGRIGPPDEMSSCIVRAYDARKAREIAGQFAGAEGSAPWLDILRSSCAQLRSNGGPEIIMRQHGDDE